MNTPKLLNIIIVEKTGQLKILSVKDFDEKELYKKCGFKKDDDFSLQIKWNITIGKVVYNTYVYGKTVGRSNNENKYDFPPPIDKKLFFGNCAIVTKHKINDEQFQYVSLTTELWEKMYEKLFGGFYDLSKYQEEDESEEDELECVPANNKTKEGYLKDGFVVDSQDDSEVSDTVHSEELTMQKQWDSISELSAEDYEY